MPATIQRLMQICLGELNLTYCLIYLDDIIIFSQMAEEHLNYLCIIFDWLREHDLKLKSSKCDFFRNEITYLAHRVSKDGVYPSNSNWKQYQNAPCHKHTPRCMLFLVWWDTTGGSARDLHTSHSPLVSVLLERGLATNQSGCCLQRIPWMFSKHWNRSVWQLLSWSSLTTPSHSC